MSQVLMDLRKDYIKAGLLLVAYFSAFGSMVLAKDGSEIGQQENPIVYVARRADILSIKLKSNGTFKIRRMPLMNTALAIAVDYDPVDDFFYWSTPRRIHRSKRNGTESETTIVSNVGDAIDGIAVDGLTKNLYWSDKTRGEIGVSKLDGSYQKTLISNMSRPRAIALDPRAGKMYWTEWGDQPRIASAFMNGENKTTLVTNDIVWPNGLAIDTETKVLYFADAGTGRIEAIHVDGSGRKILVDSVPHIFGLSYLNGFLYWTDWKLKTLERMRANDASSKKKIFSSLSRPMGLKATYLTADGLTNACSADNGGCSHLCFYTPMGVKCGCPDGQYLQDDGNTCKWI